MKTGTVLIVICAILRSSNTEECGTTIYPVRTTGANHNNNIGGVEAKPGAWPWIAALASRNKIRDENGAAITKPEFKCGGSLISNRLVLTAAHCSAEKLYLVRLGADHLNCDEANTTDIHIKRMIVHEMFNASNAANDIAVVVLVKAVEYSERIRPICLPSDTMFERDRFEKTFPYIAGWGDEDAMKGDLHLKEVQVPVTSLKQCKDIYKAIDVEITNSNICAGSVCGTKDACQGDSGGPLMVNNNKTSGLYYVIAVTSHGKGCGQPNTPSVFTRVDSYITWLQKLIKQHPSDNRFEVKHIIPREDRPQTHVLLYYK